MTLIYLLLLIAAAVCFGIAAFGRPQTRVNLMALGLLLWVAVEVIQTFTGLNVS